MVFGAMYGIVFLFGWLVVERVTTRIHCPHISSTVTNLFSDHVNYVEDRLGVCGGGCLTVTMLRLKLNLAFYL